MKKVFVGLSGGVDSAVSAYLLKSQGYEVTGVFIKGWEPDFLPCTGVRDRLEAMRVAAHLRIPFRTYDFEDAYKTEVVDYFVGEYKAGRTPNPDVMCNRTIKFGAFWEKAREEGADAIATGHYAINSKVEGGSLEVEGKLQAPSFKLLTSRDSEKDQTYFLWTLTQADLEHSLFPVGGYEKKEVRKFATEANLPNATRKDSQGLCFLGHVDMHAFLKHYLPTQNGTIYDTEGKKVGEHDGAWFYTLGEHIRFGGLKEKRYVVKKNVEKNELIVSENHLGESPQKRFQIQNQNLISPAPQSRLTARYRYRQELLPVTLGKQEVIFEEPELIAPGQSVVFYTGTACIGGAVVV